MNITLSQANLTAQRNHQKTIYINLVMNIFTETKLIDETKKKRLLQGIFLLQSHPHSEW